MRFAPQKEKTDARFLILLPHQSTQWVESQLENPVSESNWLQTLFLSG